MRNVLRPRPAVVAAALVLMTLPLSARLAPASAPPQPQQMDMRPYVRLGINGLVEVYKDPVIKNDIVTDYGTLVNRERGEYVIGSGTIVTPDGLIVTNYHVLADLLNSDLEYDDADHTLTKFTPSRMLVGEVDPRNPLSPVVDKYVAEPVDWVQDRDIALVRIATDLRTGDPIKRHDFAYTPIGNPYTIPVLAPLTVFGYPGKGGRSINPSSGPFQGFTFDVPAAIDGSIKTSAQIAGGNSGGAALYDGKLVAIPTRVSLKSEKGSDFGYLHPITWAAQVFAYAYLHYGLDVPNLQKDWVENAYNTDDGRVNSYLGGRIVSGQSKLAVTGATVVVFRADRTLEQIKDLYLTIDEVRTVLKVQKALKRGDSEADVADALKLKVAQVRAYRDMTVDISAMSPDVQAYDRGEFFYDIDTSADDGFVFLAAPRGTKLNLAVLKEGFRDFEATLDPVATIAADMGRIQILMR